MISLVAFDLDGTLAESKQPLKDTMGEAIADLLAVANVAVIPGGDWPQFQKQVASRLPARADLSKLWLMPDDWYQALYAQGGRLEGRLRRAIQRGGANQDPRGF